MVWTGNVATKIPKIPECPGVSTIRTPKNMKMGPHSKLGNLDGKREERQARTATREPDGVGVTGMPGIS